MKLRLLLIFLAAQFIGCVGKSPQKKIVNAASPTDTSQAIYADSAPSTFRMFTDDSNGLAYKSTEISYKVLAFFRNPFGRHFDDVKQDTNYITYYVAKFTTATTALPGMETSGKTISVEIKPVRSPNHTPLLIKQKCDGLVLEDDHYKTVKYGCCGGDDQLAIYDFESNLVIDGDVKIVQANIPNSKVKFYAAFKLNYEDTTTLGTLFVSYSSTDKYQVRIKPSARLPLKCEYRTPDIFIYSPNPRDNFNGSSERELWSLDNIKAKEQVNNISLKLVFECESEEVNVDTIEIPIINGRPFGKDEMVQYYSR